mgnify:CR=1 FL=1
MRIVADEKYITRRSAAGKYASLAGLAVLALALVFSFTRTSSLLLMQGALMGAMLIGVVLSFIGGYYAERFAGPVAHHKAVRSALKGLDRQYVLFQYVLPVPHVLLGPDGLTIVVVRSQPGQVTYKDGKWRHHQRTKFLRQLAGQESLGVPEEDVEQQVAQMRRYLEQRQPELEVPVRGVVLFAHPNVRLDLEEPPVPVFYDKKVRSWLRGPGAGKPLPPPVRQQLAELLFGGLKAGVVEAG